MTTHTTTSQRLPNRIMSLLRSGRESLTSEAITGALCAPGSDSHRRVISSLAVLEGRGIVVQDADGRWRAAG